MRIFISWSGERSKAVAEALRDWLPKVIQAVQPWRARDIQKGERWGVEVAAQLQESRVGIICLTPENLEAPWILFEAGALSKTLEKTYVCPYLYKVSPGEIKDPLAQFQSTLAEKEDTRHLILTINRALGDKALREPLLNDIFDSLWPDLNRKLKKVEKVEAPAPRPKRDSDILQEMHEMIKQMARG